MKTSSNALHSAGNHKPRSGSRSSPSSECEGDTDRRSVSFSPEVAGESGQESSESSCSAGFLPRRISCRRNAPAAIRKAAATSSGGVKAARSVSIGTSRSALPGLPPSRPPGPLRAEQQARGRAVPNTAACPARRPALPAACPAGSLRGPAVLRPLDDRLLPGAAGTAGRARCQGPATRRHRPPAPPVSTARRAGG